MEKIPGQVLLQTMQSCKILYSFVEDVLIYWSTVGYIVLFSNGSGIEATSQTSFSNKQTCPEKCSQSIVSSILLFFYFFFFVDFFWTIIIRPESPETSPLCSEYLYTNVEDESRICTTVVLLWEAKCVGSGVVFTIFTAQYLSSISLMRAVKWLRCIANQFGEK